ncbi:hypothetical protein, partial [Bacteroides sp. AM10-21B]|uniref:hypothetical protein n=1 Tax=Bacteroides sp. AM10-21B TaxID=2292001 RepID=UPI001C9D0273
MKFNGTKLLTSISHRARVRQNRIFRFRIFVLRKKGEELLQNSDRKIILSFRGACDEESPP